MIYHKLEEKLSILGTIFASNPSQVIVLGSLKWFRITSEFSQELFIPWGSTPTINVAFGTEITLNCLEMALN